MKRCVTSRDGKMTVFDKFGESLRCKSNDQGLGIGLGRTNYVYLAGDLYTKKVNNRNTRVITQDPKLFK